MNHSEQKATKSSNHTLNRIDAMWDRAIQFHKSGMTIGLTLLLGMVTVTGFGVQNNRAELFVIAGLIPLLAFLIDMLVKWHLIAPFLYKALSLEMQQSPDEPLAILFLDFGVGDESRLLEIFKLPSGGTRQREFRKLFMQKNLLPKIIIYGLGFGGEILLSILYIIF